MVTLNNRQKNTLLYLGVSLLEVFLFFLQVNLTSGMDLLFLIIFVMVFFFVAEIVSHKAGVFAASLAISMQLFESNYLLVLMLVLLLVYYFLVKNLRRRKLEKVTAREKYFRNLVHYSLLPLILKNEKGEIIFTSESIKDFLGFRDNHLRGKLLDEFIHPDDIYAHKQFLANVIKQPYEKKAIELRIKKDTSGWIWIRNESINLLKHKYIKAIVSSIQDITFQKELDREKIDIIKQEKTARELAEKAIRDRDQFLSIASHELKTPLTSVLLQLQATLRKISTQSLADFSGGELLTSLQIAEKQSQSLSTLIKDLLDVSVASTGKLILNKEKVDLSTFVPSIIEKYSEEIIISGCPVKIAIKSSNVVGNWDPIRIEQAISNLLTNALKYSQGKKIIISVKQQNGWGLIKIKDYGKGIPKEMQTTIFEPFKRVENGSGAKGLGVGLFIAKRIALAHQGELSVESEIGKGATFTLSLPLLSPPLK